MIVSACGVVGKNFFPNSTGALTADGLRSSGKSVAALADHAPNLLFVKNVNFPVNSPTGCGHVQGLVQSLTGRSPNGGDKNATAQGVSADVHISGLVNDGADPLTLYAGDKKNGYVVERISFKGSGSGQVRSAELNPYQLYSKLVTGGAFDGGGTTEPNPATEELVRTRRSVNDLVKADLNSLLSRSDISYADRQRLQQCRRLPSRMIQLHPQRGRATLGGACPAGECAELLRAIEHGAAWGHEMIAVDHHVAGDA